MRDPDSWYLLFDQSAAVGPSQAWDNVISTFLRDVTTWWAAQVDTWATPTKQQCAQLTNRLLRTEESVGHLLQLPTVWFLSIGARLYASLCLDRSLHFCIHVGQRICNIKAMKACPDWLHSIPKGHGRLQTDSGSAMVICMRRYMYIYMYIYTCIYIYRDLNVSRITPVKILCSVDTCGCEVLTWLLPEHKLQPSGVAGYVFLRNVLAAVQSCIYTMFSHFANWCC